MVDRQLKADPEPITIIAAVAGIISASFSAANFVKTHCKALPSETRRLLLAELDRLVEQLGPLEIEVGQIEEIFRKADYPNGPAVRFGNGALISAEQFGKYQELSDTVLERLRTVNRHTLRIEKLVGSLSDLVTKTPTNQIGEALDSIQSIFRSGDVSVEKAWKSIRSVVDQLGQMIDSLRGDLKRS